MNFSNDALLHAAATIVAGRLQARPAGAFEASTDTVSEMLAQAMTEVLGGVDLMEERAKSESMDTWQRLAGE